MGFDANGNWSSDFYPVVDRDNSVPILASKFQTLIQSNLKQSFENCILRDGTGKPTNDISFNSHKITNLANGVNSNDAINKSQLDNAVSVPAGEEQQGTIEIATTEEALAGTDDTTAMTPAKVKAVFETLTTSTRFCVNRGPVQGVNTPNAASATGSYITFSRVSEQNPLVCTKADGTTFTLFSIPSVEVSGYADGTYNILVSSAGTVSVYPNTIYRQALQPVSMNTNDIWLNTMEPFKSYIKTSNALVETDLVPLPQAAVISNGNLTIINTGYYNDNFVNNDISSMFSKITQAIAPATGRSSKTISSGVTYTADRPGWLTISYSVSGVPSTSVPLPTVKVNGTTVATFYSDGFINFFLRKGATYQVNYSQFSWHYIHIDVLDCIGLSGVTL